MQLSTSVVPLSYFHHKDGSQFPNVEPKLINFNITKINCTKTKNNQSCCTGLFCGPIDEIPIQALAGFEAALKKKIDNEPEPKERQLLVNKLMILYSVTDQRSKAVYYLEQHSTLMAKKTLAASYIETGEFTKAAQMINSISQNNVENQKFVKYHNVLLNLGINNKTVYQINGQQELDVRDVSNSATCISANAQALLKVVFDEDPLLDLTDPDSLMNNARIAATNELTNELIKENESAKLINIVPNPFNNETLIQYYLPEAVNNTEITVYDVVGKPVRSLSLNKGNTNVIINASDLENGMYFLRMKADGKFVAIKKIVVLK